MEWLVHSGKQVLTNLVAHEHDDDVGLGVVFEFLQPPFHVLEGGSLRDVVHQQRTDCAAVVGGGDGPVPLLSSCIPDLCWRMERKEGI